MSRIGETLIRQELQRLYQQEHGSEAPTLRVAERFPARVTFDIHIDGELFEVRIPEEVLQSSPLSHVTETYLVKAMRRLPPPG